MRTKRTVALSVVAAMMIVISGSVGAQAATSVDQAEADEPALTGLERLTDGDIIAWSPVLGNDDWYEVGDASVTPEGQQEAGIAQPLSASAAAAVNCGSATTVLEKFPSKYDGTIKLECGSPTGYGLKHVLNSHPEQQWRNQMGGPGNVQDFIKYLIRGSLTAPAQKANVKPNQTRCYSTPTRIYELVNGKPKYKKTINASVVASVNNKRVVTAIPSTQSQC